jgi:NaMN:DMB phosphoribosyltransferase
MCAAMLTVYQHNMTILLDGFISSAVYLVVHAINPSLKDNAIFRHLSDEYGHQNLLNFLGVDGCRAHLKAQYTARRRLWLRRGLSHYQISKVLFRF